MSPHQSLWSHVWTTKLTSLTVGTSNVPADIGAEAEEAGPQWGLIIGIPLAFVFVAGVALFIFYENKRKQNDSVWKVKREELEFSDPPEIIGRGMLLLILSVFFLSFHAPACCVDKD